MLFALSYITIYNKQKSTQSTFPLVSGVTLFGGRTPLYSEAGVSSLQATHFPQHRLGLHPKTQYSAFEVRHRIPPHYFSNGSPPEITARIRRTPADDDCSFVILNSPICAVCCTCGPPHTSLLNQSRAGSLPIV